MECAVHKLVADVALLARGEVLLVKYKDTTKYDYQKGWFLPDDYLQHLEHPDAAARRIVQEQTGLAPPDVRLVFIESFSGHGAWHLVFHYQARLDEVLSPKAFENVAAAKWFPLNALPDASEVAHDGWALDVLDKILAAYRQDLKN